MDRNPDTIMRHFEWQGRPQSMKTKYSFPSTICSTFSHMYIRCSPVQFSIACSMQKQWVEPRIFHHANDISVLTEGEGSPTERRHSVHAFISNLERHIFCFTFETSALGVETTWLMVYETVRNGKWKFCNWLYTYYCSTSHHNIHVFDTIWDTRNVVQVR